MPKLNEFESVDAVLNRWYTQEPREYTLGFYNWKIGCGDAALEVYRQFEHCMLSLMQAHDTMLRLVEDFCRLIESRGGEIMYVDDEEETHVEVDFLIEEQVWTAHVWLEKVIDVRERHVDALRNEFWLSPEQRRLDEIEMALKPIEQRIARLEKAYQHAHEEWVWWVKNGRSYMERLNWENEEYLLEKRNLFKEETLATNSMLEEAKAEWRRLKNEQRQLESLLA